MAQAAFPTGAGREPIRQVTVELSVVMISQRGARVEVTPPLKSLKGLSKRVDWRLRAILAVLSILAFLAGAAIGYAWRTVASEQDANAAAAMGIVEACMQAHTLFVEASTVLTEFPPDRLAEFSDYSSRLAGITPDAGRLAAFTSRYLGGRLLPLRRTTATVLMFRLDSRPASICAMRYDGALQAAFDNLVPTSDRFTIFPHKGYSVVLIGSVPDELKDGFATLVRRASEG